MAVQESAVGIVRIVLSVLFWIWVTILGLFVSLLGLLLFVPFSPWVESQRRAMGFVTSLWGKGSIVALPGIDFQIERRDKLLKLPRPLVFCPNHQSLAAIPLLQTFWPHAKTLVRAGLFSFPVPVASRGVAFQGTGRVLGKGPLLFRFRGRIRVRGLEPLWVSGDSLRTAADLRTRIQTAVDVPQG
jgi:hypothetical protein